MSAIRVLLVDDHRLFREGVASIMAGQPDFTVVGEASDGLEALVKAGGLRPDLILMDVRMPGMDGVEATARITAELPDTVIVMLTVREDDESLFEAIRSGARGYLLKTIPFREMANLLRGAMRGEAAISPALSGRLLEEFRRLGRPPEEESDTVALTHREIEVLRLAAEGATDAEIAAALTISVHTVKSHLRNILSKLHVRHRQEAARYARRERLIDWPPAAGDEPP